MTYARSFSGIPLFTLVEKGNLRMMATTSRENSVLRNLRVTGIDTGDADR